MRSMCGSSSSARTRMAERFSGAARWPTMARPGRAWRAFLSVVSAGRARQSHRQAQCVAIESLLYVRLIPPGAADVAHYRVRIPKDANGPITFTARLQYGSSRTPTRSSRTRDSRVLDNRRAPSVRRSTIACSRSSRPIFGQRLRPDQGSHSRSADHHLATAKTTLQVGDGSKPTVWRPLVEKQSRERWNDWGIGLLLQGDLKGAEAFKQVTKAEPGYADGWLNVARALIQEGETDAAKPYIREALARDDTLGRIHYFKALTEKADGDYAAAIASLERVARQYPRDRVVLNQLRGFCFSIAAMPNRWPSSIAWRPSIGRCADALHGDARRTRSRRRGARRSGREIVPSLQGRRGGASDHRPTALLKPEDNNERQSIHEHESVPLRPSSASARGRR